MKVTLTASTGAKILVWRDAETFHAQLAGGERQPEICLGVDLFEVIAELAGLDLEDSGHSEEALALAEDAQRQLTAAFEPNGHDPQLRPPA